MLFSFHLSCAKAPKKCSFCVYSPGPGTRIERRSGYVVGSAALNGRSVRNVNVPFKLSWALENTSMYSYWTPMRRLWSPFLPGMNQEKVSSSW